MHKKLQIFVFFILSTFAFSQTAPVNSRLFQVNTVKGSELKIVESTPQNVYHVGTANSEIGFDGLSFNQVGLDDLYILKSNASDGGKVWFKTFNAGVNGMILPGSIYVDSSNNIFVYGTFSGSISAGSSVATSSNTINGFLLKLNSSGTAQWVKPLQLSKRTITNLRLGAGIATDATDVFVAYNSTNLMRINNADGATIYDKTFNGADFRTILLKNSELYAGGSTESATTVFNSETITGINQGFLIKGDKNAVFNASVQTKNPGNFSNITNIAFANDGDLLISGFNVNKISLKTSGNDFQYTYVPDQNFSNNKLYTFIAKIKTDLATLSYFRTSSVIGSSSQLISFKGDFDTKIIPIANDSKYRMVISSLRYTFNSPLKKSNGQTLNYSSGFNPFSYLQLDDINGDFSGGSEPLNVGFKISTAGDFYAATSSDFRKFSSKEYDLASGNLVWTKDKTNSVGGSLKIPFVQHLFSAPGESFFTTLVEGKGNFFGQQINNDDNKNARLITRLGIDGLPKWFAKFENDFGFTELGSTNQFANVDKDDNFYFLARTEGLNSSFTDAVGTVINFPQSAGTSSEILIKIDKDGKYLWSKNMVINGFQDGLRSVLITDNAGDIYMMGNNAGSSFVLDGSNFTALTFVIKLSGTTGSIIFGKNYDNFLTNYINPAFDSQNSLYLFVSPSSPSGTQYVLDGITVPFSPNYDEDQLMLKFDSSGNVIWGKNFYANAPLSSQGSYSSTYDVKFDGTDFIVLGSYFGTANNDFLGLDLQNIPKTYSSVNLYAGLVAKISTAGNVIWQKALQPNTFIASAYNSIDLDDQKNIYAGGFAKDKLKIDGTEYTFDAEKGNKVVHKFNTNGVLQYNIVGNQYRNPYPVFGKIDVIKNDAFNVMGTKIVSLNDVQNFTNSQITTYNLYVKTYGNLTKKYMTPVKNYMELNAIAISNNPTPTPNEYLFDLINNVNWTATSDQPWLNLSSISLLGKNPQNTITGNGDAKITLTADQNTSGATRSSNVNISGEGVPAKTVIVSQTATLATGESKISVITLYPNPTSDFLNIKSDQKISKVELYDMSGKLMMYSKFNDNVISVASLPKGNYILKIFTASGVVTSKFIKK